MNIDEQLSELKAAWRDSPAPDVADLTRRVRRARLRSRFVVALEIVLTLVGVGVGVVLLKRDGWFAGAIGVLAILLSVWALHIGLAIRRRGRTAMTDTVSGQLGQLIANARTNLALVRAGYAACLVGVLFVGLVYGGSVLKLPGAPSDMLWRSVFALIYLGGFALVSHLYAGRVRRELERLRAIEASLEG